MILKTIQQNTGVRTAATRHFKPPENQRAAEGIPPFPTEFCINIRVLYFDWTHRCVACRAKQSALKQRPQVILEFSYGRKV